MNKVKIGIGVGFGVVIAGIIAFRHLGEGGAGGSAAPGNGGAGAGAISASGDTAAAPVEITMLYGTDKKDWVDAAAESFRRAHPEIKLTLVARGSMEGAQAILDRRDRPTVFSPADSLALNMLASDWKNKGREPLFAEAGDDAPSSLVMTPLVFVAWDDRARALVKDSGEVSWKAIHKATSSPQGWTGVGGKPEWGFVKLGHTDPTRSNSGLQAVMLMALDETGKPTLETSDLVDPKVQSFVRQIEKSVPSFEASTGTFMNEMVRFGPSKYDIAVVYENLAIAQIATAQARWGTLRVVYPKTTMWSDHPAAVLTADWVTPEQRAAAHVWLAHLRSRPVQERALAFGFRPGDTAVPVRTADPENPFTKLARYGVRVEVPHAARTPDGATVRTATTMWTRTCAPRSREEGAVR